MILDEACHKKLGSFPSSTSISETQVLYPLEKTPFNLKELKGCCIQRQRQEDDTEVMGLNALLFVMLELHTNTFIDAPLAAWRVLPRRRCVALLNGEVCVAALSAVCDAPPFHHFRLLFSRIGPGRWNVVQYVRVHMHIVVF